MKKIASMWLALLLVLFPFVAGCSTQNNSSEDEIHYVDQDFMTSLAKGLEARWKLNDQYETQVSNGTIKSGSSEEKDAYGSWVDAELNEVEQYRNEPFEDSQLQQLALQYISALNDQKSSLDDWGTDKFREEWSAAYDKRTTLLAEFVGQYNLTVSEKYQDQLDTLKATGKQVQATEAEKEAISGLVNNFSFEQTAEEYGYKTYTAIVENTSEYNLKSFYADVSLLNSDGVLVGTEYASADNWQAGQKAQFEFSTDEDFATTTITINSWEDDQGNSSYD